MKETIQDLLTRRSCRAYRSDAIPEDVLNKILEAGTYAPTGMNRQSPIIIAVTNPEVRNELSRLNAAVINSTADPFYGAPVVLTVLADAHIVTHVDDGNMVISNLMNAAHALGIDSCYIYRAREVFKSPRGKELLKQWGVQGEYEGIGNVILGYGLPEGFRSPSPRKQNYVIRVR